MSDATRSGRGFAVGMLVPAAVLALAALRRAWPDVLDDAYITFRCAARAAAGHVPSFNAGPPVESYSNPLLLALLVPCSVLGLSLPVVARIIGLVALGASVVAAGRLVRLAGGSQKAVWLGIAAALGCFPLVYYAATGLETALFAALVAGAVWRWLAAGERLDALGAVLWLGVATCRPEGPLVLACFAPLLARTPQDARRRTIAWAVAIGGALIALELARRYYYGDWVPNAFHAKSLGTADHNPQTLGPGVSLAYLADFLATLGLVLPVAAIIALLGRPRRPWALVAPVVAGVGFALYAGGDWMPGSRYLVPYVPLVAALGALGLDVVSERLRLGRPALVMGLAAIGAWLGSLSVLWQFTSRAEEHPFHVMNARDCLAAARAMRTRLPPGARVVAYRIGALGWAGDFEVIDLLGLADRRIARIVAAHPEYHPRSTRMGEDLPELRDYVASRDPQALLVTAQVAGRLEVSCERYGRRWRLDQTYPQGSDERWALYVPEGERPSEGER